MRTLPDALAFVVNSIGRAALARTTGKLEIEQQWVQAIEQDVKANGKFAKFATVYVAFHPPPVYWPYYCGRCRWWVETGNDPAVGRCSVVEGDINWAGWCSIFMPPDGEPILSWLRRYPQDLARLARGFLEAVQAPLGREKILPTQHFPEAFGERAVEAYEEPKLPP